jgi:hypothetical protein
VEGSLVVNALPGYGALEAGMHRFYSRQRDGSEHLDATARFIFVWSKETGSWKLVRVLRPNLTVIAKKGYYPTASDTKPRNVVSSQQ